jgi:hypothetical protein
MECLDFHKLAPGNVATVKTRNSTYKLSRRLDGKCNIWGNGDFFKTVEFLGSRKGGIERPGQIVLGFHVVIDREDGRLPLETSSVQSINVC